MGLFGDKKGERLDALEKEAMDLKALIIELQGDVTKKTSDYENEAKQASRKTAEYRNRAEERKTKADELLASMKETVRSATELHSSVLAREKEMLTIDSSLQTILNQASSVEKALLEKSTLFDNRIERAEAVFDEHPDLETDLEELNDFLSRASGTLKKINQIQANAANRKSEIDELHLQILGHDEIDEETEESHHIEGLKDKLESQYDVLLTGIKDLGSQLQATRSDSENDYETVKTSWETKYEALEAEIRGLLPNALTAGLSSAFSAKREDEEASSVRLYKQFKAGIWGLIGVSLIPFSVSSYLMFIGQGLDDVIYKIPRIILSILPIYIPVLWVAYSGNKKLNLSKRLIEEYAHKEVLSKTFEGLARQIESIDDKTASERLRTKLLYDFLFASAENPGKLITGYEKSDHPIMEALEKAYKLEGLIDKVHNIPGLNGMVDFLRSTSSKILTDKNEPLNKIFGENETDTDEEKA